MDSGQDQEHRIAAAARLRSAASILEQADGQCGVGLALQEADEAYEILGLSSPTDTDK